MGEKSRFIGEIGEKIFDGFAELFGWSGADNISVACNRRAKHNKQTHGIDFLAVHKSPMINRQIEVGVVSVKNVKSGKEKSKLELYVEDVLQASECFKRTSEFDDYIPIEANASTFARQVIFWLQHDQDPEYTVIPKILKANRKVTGGFNAIHIVDNRIVSFHYDLQKFVKNSFPTARSISYFYQDTGLNDSFDKLRLLKGSVLPISWLNSPLIPYRVDLNDNRSILVIGVNEAFDEDVLKRVSGLAQSLTGGWCNSIILAFPDFDFQKHKEIKDKVLVQIEDKQFAKMIVPQSFKSSFRALSLSDSISYNDYSEVEKPEFNIERMLPYGDTLRQLLNQKYITKADIVKLLNFRGVLVPSKTTKAELVPLLTTSFLSPSELEFLRNCQLSRLSSERISSSNIIVKDGDALTNKLLDQDFLISDVIEFVAPHVTIKGTPKFKIQQDGAIELKIPTQNQYMNKDWASSNSNNHTTIRISPLVKHGEFQKARIDVVASTEENKKVGKQLVKQIETVVKQDGNLRDDFTLEQTLAIEFNNTKRAELLFQVFKVTKSVNSHIEFKDLKNVDFTLSEDTTQISDDFINMRDNIERSIFTGSKLQDIKYISDSSYYDAIVFREVIAVFSFKKGDYSGEFEVQYGFPDFDYKDRESKSEFEYKITRVTPFVSEALSRKLMHEITSYLKDEFAKIKQAAIDETDKKYGRQGILFK